MITIYNPSETEFLSDGLGLIDSIVTDAAITEELNGAYYLELTAIIDDDGQFELLDYDNIIKANGQYFRISDIDKDSSFITIKALHIFYDLSNNFLEDVAPTDKNCGDALRWILERTQYPNLFQGSSDISDLKTARYVRYSPTDAIMGNLKNSFLNTWGGELRRSNYAIEILSRLGADNGVEISYGKNITGIQETIVKNNVFTKIMPMGYNGMMIPEKYVESPYILSYPMAIIRKVEFPEIKINADPNNGMVLNEEQAQEELRLAAQSMFTNDKVDLPLVNYKVNFIDLTQTEEYKDYKVLETISLGDTVAVNHTRLKLTVSARCIKTVFDVLAKRYRNIELGNFNQNLQSYIKQVTEQAQKNIFIESILEASQLIKSGLGGYVLKTRDELLVMDTDDINTAVEVWRWNKNGLGYSSTGYNGIYGLALTKDGKVNADMIKTGKLLAQYIQADSLSAISANLGEVITGKLRSADGTLEIDLTNKTFKIGSGTESVHTDLQYNGMQIKDGENLIAAFGESGAVIPYFEADDYDCPVIAGVINESASFNVGAGQTYPSVGYVLQTVLKGRRVLNGAILEFNIYGAIDENIYISGFNGTGSLTFNLYNGAQINGGFTFVDTSTRIYVYKAGTGRPKIKRTTTEPIVVKNCTYVALTSLDVDCAGGGGAGVYGMQGSFVKMDDVDIANGAQWAVIAIDGAEFRCFGNRGNATSAGYAAQYGGVIYTWGTSPNANAYQNYGSVIGTLNPTASTFSVPPVTAQTFTSVFGPTSMYTVNHDTASVDSYYGSAAAQGKYSGMSYWKDGVMTFGANIYNFWQGGYNVLVEMRVRRKNSSHGTSSGVTPLAYNFSPSEAFNAIGQGVWSEWTTVPAAVFGSGGAALKFYNGNLNSGYAIFDACEVKVTVTKDV